MNQPYSRKTTSLITVYACDIEYKPDVNTVNKVFVYNHEVLVNSDYIISVHFMDEDLFVSDKLMTGLVRTIDGRSYAITHDDFCVYDMCFDE